MPDKATYQKNREKYIEQARLYQLRKRDDPKWRQMKCEQQRRQREKAKLDPSKKKPSYDPRYRHIDVAHVEVWRALKKGKLVRPELCEECGKAGNIQAHHEDYSRKLDVKWLCSVCHGKTWRRL